MSFTSRTPSLTPSRSPTPVLPVQPDHFYGAQDIHLPPSPDSDGKTWLDPEDDPLAHRGIPVFKPTMEEFQDFEGYMNQVECWGSKSGIVKVIPPKEWVDALPSYQEQLSPVKIKTPIEQHMLGRGGLFRQENIEKRRIMSIREWAELCGKEDLRAPGVNDVGLHARSANVTTKPKSRRGRKKAGADKAETAEPEGDGEGLEVPGDDDQEMDDCAPNPSIVSPPDTTSSPSTPAAITVDAIDPQTADAETPAPDDDDKLKRKTKRPAQTREAREANLAERAARDAAFLETFNPQSDWLPPNTSSSDYTPEFCQKLERQYWRNCGLGKPAWYGADTQGSLYTDATTAWNVAHLPSTLSRILPASSKGLPGVNTPYLYFGMWRATFAWHVEDMDLFSINYIHFGAPKFWYAIPQGRAGAMEQTMRGYFPKDTSQCPQFLRHKSFLASPNLLGQSSCRPNILVQQAGEFVITFPRGYHAGFNLGFNCAESVNFALESWLDLGRKAKACECITDSVRIDVDQLLADRAAERSSPAKPRRSTKVELDQNGKPKTTRKRKSDGADGPKAKKIKAKNDPPSAKPFPSKLSVMLKLGPKPPPDLPFPCCLCVSMSQEGLLRVQDPPIGLKDMGEPQPTQWMAHETCANVVPETWVDDIEVGEPREDGTRATDKVVFGVDGIVKDRWNLKCSACTKARQKAHGAPVQCTKGKCPKAFHVSCAQDGAASGIVYDVLREVEKEVVLLEPTHGQPDFASSAQVVPVPGDAMNVDVVAPPQPLTPDTLPTPQVLKIIKKIEVQILCTQHNPAIAAAKKASKQDKIRNDLLALPSMTRIKIRVSAGVFEVSLLRVIEATGSVEVLWDRGIKREFKWGSVVFGSTEGQTVLQKPSEPAPESEQAMVSYARATSHPVIAFPSVSATTSAPTPQPVTPSYLPPPSHPTANSATPQFPSYATHSRQYDYAPGAWTYQYQQQVPGAAQPPNTAHPAQVYQYGDYYRNNPPLNGSYQPYSGYYPSQSQPYRQIQWQTSWRPRDSTAPSSSTPRSQISAASANGAGTSSSGQQPASNSRTATPVGTAYSGSLHHPTQDSDRPTSTPLTMQAALSSDHEANPQRNSSVPRVSASDISSLSSLEPSHIESILLQHPDLRHIVQAAVDKQQVTNKS